MQLKRPAGEITVARYDDDYPLLYGEPAVQPRWEPSAPAGAACGATGAAAAAHSESEPALPCRPDQV